MPSGSPIILFNKEAYRAYFRNIAHTRTDIVQTICASHFVVPQLIYNVGIKNVLDFKTILDWIGVNESWINHTRGWEVLHDVEHAGDMDRWFSSYWLFDIDG